MPYKSKKQNALYHMTDGWKNKSLLAKIKRKTAKGKNKRRKK